MDIKSWLVRMYLKFRLKKKSVIHLNKEDSEEFLEVLNNPPEPNEALLNAAKHHKETIHE